jgi:hypothetical protein
MEVLRPIEFTRIDELKILQNVRLLHKHDLNPIYSKENLIVQFEISGDIKGTINCYLCLDQLELSESDKNYLFPLFIESMNILTGKQITQDDEFSNFKIQMSPPKLSMIPREINSSLRIRTQKYDLEMDDTSYKVLVDYNLQAAN